MSERLTCQVPGCSEEAIECHLNDDENTVEYFCATHCFENGYCFGCGNFLAGAEDFDFEPSHLCSNCRDEVEDEDVEIPEDPELGDPWQS